MMELKLHVMVTSTDLRFNLKSATLFFPFQSLTVDFLSISLCPLFLETSSSLSILVKRLLFYHKDIQLRSQLQEPNNGPHN